ncbi:MAG: hypothetical protein KA914_05040 [Ottowia sp.]|nr:hypothetical protein [Ottowia sp.]
MNTRRWKESLDTRHSSKNPVTQNAVRDTNEYSTECADADADAVNWYAAHARVEGDLSASDLAEFFLAESRFSSETINDFLQRQ